MSRGRGHGAPRGEGRRNLAPEEVRAGALEGFSPSVLRALGLVRADGSASADAARKIKQVAHFLRLLEPALGDVFARHPDPVLVDAGAGKTYLGFALHEAWCRRQGRGTLIAVERRPELVAAVRGIAEQGGCARVDVRQGELGAVALPERLHMVVALHACDTATDDAILSGLRGRADWIAVVPCSQAEVARQLADLDRATPIRALWGDAHHRREFGAHLTNVLRALVLRARGYAVTVTELVGWEHSLKNELILARRVGAWHRPSERELEALLGEIPVEPALIRGLRALAADQSPTSSIDSSSAGNGSSTDA